MPLPFQKKKQASIGYIIKKLSGSDTYENMKDHNESGKGMERLLMHDEPQSEYDMGMKQAVSEMMNAVEAKDAQSFESGLKAYIDMLLDARDDEKKLIEKQD